MQQNYTDEHFGIFFKILAFSGVGFGLLANGLLNTILFMFLGALFCGFLGMKIDTSINNKKVALQIKTRTEKFDRQKNTIKSIVNTHLEVLARKRHQLIIENDYGVVDKKKWIAELKKYNSTVVKDKLKYIEPILLQDYELDMFVDMLVEQYQTTNKDELLLNFDTSMSGLEYEQYCADLLIKDDWKAQVTQGSGDQGVDVVAIKKGKTIAIQCKKYGSPVGNKAVQEAHAGKGFIRADYAAVVTNSSFTPSAKTLSKSLNVLLLHHSQLQLLNEVI